MYGETIHNKERYITQHCFNFQYSIFDIDNAGTKRKCKQRDLPSDVVTLLTKLDEQADKRMEERERKMMMLQAELEEKRREQERKYEERMNTMMLNFMQHIMHFPPARSGYQNSSPSFPLPSFPPGPPPFHDDFDNV